MKYTITTLMVLASLSSSFAQHTNYNKSVFYNLQPIQSANNAKTTAQVKQTFSGWAVMTDKHGGNFTDIYGQPLSITGNTPAEKAMYCMSNMLNKLGIDAAQWKQAKEAKNESATIVHYSQSVNGHEVVFSKLSFRFSKDGKLVRVKANYYGNTPAASTITIDKDAAMNMLAKDINTISVTDKKVADSWYWFPVPTAKGYELQPAWRVDVRGKGENGMPVYLQGYVHATTGEVLYRTNGVRDAFDVTVKGSVYNNGKLLPVSDEPLAHLKIEIDGSTYHTDTVGKLNEPSISGGTVTYSLDGLWSTVVDNNAFAIPQFTQALTGTGNSYTFSTVAPSGRQHINAYYHVNKVHDFMKKVLPAFTALDIPMVTNVDVSTGACNAFFDPGSNSINFFTAGSGCVSFAEVPDIVYHEYGHAISENFYIDKGLFGLTNGAIHEGNSDIWAISITKNPLLGEGSFTGGGGMIRRYDRAAKVYPMDIVGEPHGDGEIIAGAWWDVAQNLGNIDTMSKIFARSYFDVPDGPDGTEGQVFHDVLISALMNDDDDANLTNGTPHFSAIVSGFAKHGIYLLGDVTITHTELSNQPANTAITVNASVVASDMTFFQGTKVYYRKRGTTTWNEIAMASTGGNNYSGSIPAQNAGSIIDYYIAATTFLSNANGIAPAAYDTSTLKPQYITLPYQFGVGLSKREGVDFETPATGWVIGNAAGDNATGGIWIQAKPVESSTFMGTICQTGADHTTGSGQCLVTGNAPSTVAEIGVADVDNGTTTVVTPVFNLSAYNEPVIEYHRWFGNKMTGGDNDGGDQWLVQIGNNSGGAWQNVDATYASDYSWRKRIFSIKDYLTSLTDVQLKFIASDLVNTSEPNNGQNVVEAAVDDFIIYSSDGTGIGNTEIAKARVYPNPADDKLYIEVAANSTGTIQLADVTGRLVQTVNLNAAQAQYMIDTKSIVPGVYSLIVQTQAALQSTKVVISHR